MKDGNLCELCKGEVQPEKARHKQTKYCVRCARVKKRENTEDPWPPEKRRAYMRRYMRTRRAQARLYCLPLFLLLFGTGGLSPEAFQTFDEVATLIGYVELIALKVTGLAFIVVICARHLKHALQDGEKKQEERRSVPIVDDTQSATLKAQSPSPGDLPPDLQNSQGERLQVPRAPTPGVDGEIRALPERRHHKLPHAAAERQRLPHEGDGEDDPRKHRRRP